MKNVVIVGGGFAGLNCARKLATHTDIHITLIDKNNYQQFQPLLYQVASGFLAPSNVAFSLRNVLVRHPNVDVRMDRVVSADLKTRTVTTVNGQTYQGDYLVLAAGSQANFFGTPGADKYTYPLYSLHDAELLRSRILSVLEAAARDSSVIEKGALNFVIVAPARPEPRWPGCMGDMIHRSLKEEYPHLALEQVGIYLVDAGDVVLNGFSDKAHAYALKQLEERSVRVHLHTKVSEVAHGHVVFSDGTVIRTHTIIWAGGLKASELAENIGVKTGHGSRLDVAPDLTVPGFDRVYALGDFANLTSKGKSLPQLASVAEQAGKWCAKNIVADVEGKDANPSTISTRASWR